MKRKINPNMHDQATDKKLKLFPQVYYITKNELLS